MSPALVTSIMFGSLFILILAAFPIAFATAIVGLVCAYILWGPSSGFLLITSASGAMNNWVLVAIPLFIFMALLLHGLEVVRDLYNAIHKWAGPLPGGLAVATIFVGTVMGAMTGLVAGVLIALGIIALPQMLTHGYDKRISLGVVMAGGSQAQLVPPSGILIVYGAVTQTSVGGLFAGALSAGLLLAILYSAYVLVRGWLNKGLCPVIPREERATWREKVQSLKLVILPMFVVVVVLGAIFAGIATPTEAAGFGCVGALICGLVTRRLRWSIISNAAIETLQVSTFILWILIGSLVFGSVFAGIGGHLLVNEILQETPFGALGGLTISMFMIFVLGCFMDQTAIIVITAPMFASVAVGLGFHPIWFGVVFQLLLVMGFLTPPFGYALYYLKSVAPKEISIGEIIRAAMPFIGLQVIGTAFIVAFPKITLWLPSMLFEI